MDLHAEIRTDSHSQHPHGSDSFGPLYNSSGEYVMANPLPEDDQFPGLCRIKTQVVAFRPFGDMLELLTSRSKMFLSHQQIGVIRELRPTCSARHIPLLVDCKAPL